MNEESSLYVGAGYYRDNRFQAVVVDEPFNGILKLDNGLTLVLTKAYCLDNTFLVYDEQTDTEMLFYYLKRNVRFERIIVYQNVRYCIKVTGLNTFEVRGGGTGVKISLNTHWYRVSLLEIVSLAFDQDFCHPKQRQARFNVLNSGVDHADPNSLHNVHAALEKYQDLFPSTFHALCKEMAILESGYGCEIREQEAKNEINNLLDKSKARISYLSENLSSEIFVLGDKEKI
ncbi:hypothetical protein L1D14_10625 [Vibrio tubiashii]|uniref:hypothetical protein n=1 Tax=Vibrio tubiashii TaxID=29498 RepID=UPI001EFCE845|nr:hypothetical protein [Vibrio tubiashii]MCG9576692.1 hypothetical protein [Vibrio tubiashii]